MWGFVIIRARDFGNSHICGTPKTYLDPESKVLATWAVFKGFGPLVFILSGSMSSLDPLVQRLTLWWGSASSCGPLLGGTPLLLWISGFVEWDVNVLSTAAPPGSYDEKSLNSFTDMYTQIHVYTCLS